MNKQELIAKIAKDTGATKVGAAAALESLLDGITQVAEEGRLDHVRRLRHLQDRRSARRAPRATRRPAPPIKIPKRRVVRFTAGKALKDAVK